jgi:hypothetical protein
MKFAARTLRGNDYRLGTRQSQLPFVNWDSSSSMPASLLDFSWKVAKSLVKTNPKRSKRTLVEWMKMISAIPIQTTGTCYIMQRLQLIRPHWFMIMNSNRLDGHESSVSVAIVRRWSQDGFHWINFQSSLQHRLVLKSLLDTDTIRSWVRTEMDIFLNRECYFLCSSKSERLEWNGIAARTLQGLCYSITIMPSIVPSRIPRLGTGRTVW